MRHFGRSTIFGAGVLLALALPGAGCEDSSEPQFTPVRNMEFEPAPGPPVGGGPPAADAGDGGADGGDSGLDAGDAVAETPDSAVVDAAMPDMAAELTCDFDDDCALAVPLVNCSPCPISVHVETILADRCLVPFIPGAVLGAYAPADCWADCGEAAGEACFEPPVAPICVDGPGGRCGVLE